MASLKFKRNPPKKLIRQIGIFMATFATAILVYNYLSNNHTTLLYIIPSAFLSCAITMAISPKTKVGHTAYLIATYPGYILNYSIGLVILSIFFYSIVTMIGLLLKATKRLSRKPHTTGTNWSEIAPSKLKAQHEHQF
jgi:hypothetical protein